MKPTQILCYGGCGRKILSVITGESDLYFFNNKSTKRWDTAAG